jgi:hypothetical protein
MTPERLFFAVIVCFLPNLALGQTWAEKLGYPSGKRVLILHANYMGSAYEFNRPGQELLEQGSIQSASLMVPCPWFEEFAAWARQHPDHDIGICLTLNSPGKLYRWRPLGTTSSSSLTDPDGYLWGSELQLALGVDADQVAEEIDRQIQKAKRAGVRPSHLIPFMGSLLTRPDLAKLYLDVAQRNWIPAVMVELTPKNIEMFRQDGFPITAEMIDLIAQYPLPKLDELHFVPEAESYEETRDHFYQLVRGLPPGLTQIISGPAEQTPAIQRITPNWQHRVWENQLLSDDQVHQFLQDEGIVLTNWKEIMLRFETGAAIQSGKKSKQRAAVSKQ